MVEPKSDSGCACNHELWDPYVEMEDNVEIYRKFFAKLGIVFLQNDLMCVEDRKKCEIFSEAEIQKKSKEELRNKAQCSSVIILGGIGFSGLNKKFNASNIRYGKVLMNYQEKQRGRKIYKRQIVLILYTQKYWNV